MTEQPVSAKDYHEYINSAEWQKKKEHYHNSKLPKNCLICEAPYQPGFHLHHRTYKRLGAELISTDLRMCCPDCHTYIHKIEKKEKMNVWRATKVARRRWRANGKTLVDCPVHPKKKKKKKKKKVSKYPYYAGTRKQAHIRGTFGAASPVRHISIEGYNEPDLAVLMGEKMA